MDLQTSYPDCTATMAQRNVITVGGKRFHYQWLRDNCPSCRYTAPLQQLYDPKISDRPENPQPLSLDLNDETLTIDWDETPAHRSVFEVSWLLAQAYDPQPPSQVTGYFLWHQDQLKQRYPQDYDAQASTARSWMQQLFSLGFVVLKNIPLSELEGFLSSIGPIYNVDYGTIFALENGVTTQESASRRDGCALPPHNDLSYWGGHRLVQFLCCVEHQALGGESILVDGFRVVEDFRQAYPQYFRRLMETPVQFWLLDTHHRYHFCHTAPILECDRNGNLTTVRFSKRNCRPHLPFDQLEDFYEAYNAFFHYLQDPRYKYQFCLQPQDCLLFQNFRILHGRTAFDPTTGKRKLKSGYVDWNFFVGRQNFENSAYF